MLPYAHASFPLFLQLRTFMEFWHLSGHPYVEKFLLATLRDLTFSRIVSLLDDLFQPIGSLDLSFSFFWFSLRLTMLSLLA